MNNPVYNNVNKIHRIKGKFPHAQYNMDIRRKIAHCLKHDYFDMNHGFIHVYDFAAILTGSVAALLIAPDKSALP